MISRVIQSEAEADNIEHCHTEHCHTDNSYYHILVPVSG